MLQTNDSITCRGDLTAISGLFSSYSYSLVLLNLFLGRSFGLTSLMAVSYAWVIWNKWKWYGLMIEEGNQRDGFMSSNRAVKIILKMIWVVIDWASQWRLRVSEILLERLGKQIAAFFGQNAKQLLERFKGLAQFQVIKISSAFGKIVQIKRNVAEQRSIVVRVIPGPTWQV